MYIPMGSYTIERTIGTTNVIGFRTMTLRVISRGSAAALITRDSSGAGFRTMTLRVISRGSAAALITRDTPLCEPFLLLHYLCSYLVLTTILR